MRRLYRWCVPDSAWHLTAAERRWALYYDLLPLAWLAERLVDDIRRQASDAMERGMTG